jgi:hypothetical protein
MVRGREAAQPRSRAILLARAEPVGFLRERLDLLRSTDPLDVDPGAPCYAVAAELTPDFIADAPAEAFRRVFTGALGRRWRETAGLAPRSARQAELLRGTLAVLLDQQRPLPDRLDQLWPARIQADRFSPGALTPLLHITAAHEHSVWNRDTESALSDLGLFPDRPWDTVGGQYAAVDQAQRELAEDLHLSLWQLENLLRSVHRGWQCR